MKTVEAVPKFPFEVPAPLADVTQESQRRRKELVIACRMIAAHGLDWGTAGHITVRDAENPENFWVNAYGRHFGTLTMKDLLLVDANGKVLRGGGVLNPASFAVHAAIHEGRADVLAAAHGHPLYGKTWASTGRKLDPLSQDSCAFFEDHAVLELYSGIVLSEEEGTLITNTLGDRKALILQNHGILTVGTSIESCIFWFIALENACHVQIMAEGLREPPQVLPDAVARRTAQAIGREQVGYAGYQNLRQHLLMQYPELEHAA